MLSSSLISIVRSILFHPFLTLAMGSGAKTKGKRQAGAVHRYTRRMRALKSRSKDLDRIQVILTFDFANGAG